MVSPRRRVVREDEVRDGLDFGGDERGEDPVCDSFPLVVAAVGCLALRLSDCIGERLVAGAPRGDAHREGDLVDDSERDGEQVVAVPVVAIKR